MEKKESGVLSAAEQQFALFLWEDECKLIASGKEQRWDVLKWAVSVNLALATASIALPGWGKFFIGFAAMVASISLYLINYYNGRMLSARERSEKIAKMFGEPYPKLAEAYIAPPGPLPAPIKERPEILIYTLILALSVVPTVVVAQ